MSRSWWTSPSGTALAFSPGGRLLAIGGGQTVRVARVGDAQEEFSTRVEAGVKTLTFSPGGHCLSAACSDRIVRVWDLQTHDEVARVIHEGQIHAIAFEEQDGLLATASEDGTARVWDCSAALFTTQEANAPSKRVGRFDGRVAGSHPDTPEPTIPPSPPAWPPRDPWKRIGPSGTWRIESNHGQIRVSREHADAPTLTISDVADVVAFDPGRDRLAAVGLGGGENTIRLWDVARRRELAQFRHDGKVLALAFSPDHTCLASGSKDGSARLWDVETLRDKPRHTLIHPRPTAAGSKARPFYLPQPGDVGLLGFTHDGHYLVTGCFDIAARIWEVAGGRLAGELTHPDVVRTLEVCPGRLALATVAEDDLARVWDLPNRSLIAVVRHPTPFIPYTGQPGTQNAIEVHFSPDGRRLISTGTKSTFTFSWLWLPEDVCEAARARLTRPFSATERSLYFSNDPQRTATGAGQ